MKRVMMVEMNGRKLVVEQHQGKQYQFRVYDLIGYKHKYHLDSFENFKVFQVFQTHTDCRISQEDH